MVAVLLGVFGGALDAIAQSSRLSREERRAQKQEDAAWNENRKQADLAYQKGAELSAHNPVLLGTIRSELESRMRFSSKTAPEIAERVLQYGASLGHPNPKLRFRFFRILRQDHPYCWQIMMEDPEWEQLLKEIHEALQNQNPQFVDCSLQPDPKGLVESRCFYPMFSKEVQGTEAVYRRRLKLWSFEDRVKRNRCNGLAENVGQKRVFSPRREAEYLKDVPATHWVQIKDETQDIRLDLDGIITKTIQKRLDRIRSMAEEEISVANKDFNDRIRAAQKKLDEAQVFQVPKQKKFAFLIDNSGSIEKVKSDAIDSIKLTIQKLKSDQWFTIAFLSDSQSFLNGGTLVQATPENIASALQFLESQKHSGTGGEEPFDQGIDQIMARQKVEAFYFFGDGDWNSSVQYHNLNFARSGGVPIHIRAMGESEDGFFRQVAQLSGGSYNDKPFDSNQYRASAEEVEALEKEIEKAQKDRQKKIKEMEDERDRVVQSELEKLERFKNKMRTQDGTCPKVTQPFIYPRKSSRVSP